MVIIKLRLPTKSSTVFIDLEQLSFAIIFAPPESDWNAPQPRDEKEFSTRAVEREITFKLYSHRWSNFSEKFSTPTDTDRNSNEEGWEGRKEARATTMRGRPSRSVLLSKQHECYLFANKASLRRAEQNFSLQHDNNLSLGWKAILFIRGLVKKSFMLKAPKSSYWGFRMSAGLGFVRNVRESFVKRKCSDFSWTEWTHFQWQLHVTSIPAQ